jgi:hypothetical protein
VADPEAGDRGVVGHLVCADNSEGDVLAAAALDPVRRAFTDGVGVGKQGEHHLRVVGGAALAVGAIGGVEGVAVELVDRFDHEPGEVVFVEPLAQVRGHQKGLITVAREEVLGHSWMVQNDADSRGLCDTLT